MSRPSNIFFAILFLTAVGLSVTGENVVGQNLTVKIYNRTDQDIGNLTIGTTFVGNIAKDSGYPDPKLSSYIGGFELTNHQWSWCASEIRPRTEGKLEFDLGVKLHEGQAYLYVARHE